MNNIEKNHNIFKEFNKEYNQKEQLTVNPETDEDEKELQFEKSKDSESEYLSSIIREKLEKIRNEIINFRNITKEHDYEGRVKKAQDVLNVRRKIKNAQDNVETQRESIEKIEKEIIFLKKQKNQKNEDILKRKTSVLIRFKDALNITDQRIINLQKEIQEIQDKIRLLAGIPYGQLAEGKHRLKNFIKELEELPNPRESLEVYHNEVLTIPLSNEQKRDLLRPEVLAELSTDEYTALWRRMNPHYLAHTTRQGFRDHYGHIYHYEGMEEFHSGFVDLLKDEKLIRSPLAVREEIKKIDFSSIEQWLLKKGVFTEEDKKKAIEKLEIILPQNIYPDRAAIHFSVQEVADHFYGGERNNEVFFVFPADVIGSQYSFAFTGVSSFEKDKNASMTDVFVWPNNIDNLGIPVDAGFVFLPKNILVDPNTGSKYVSEIKTIEGKQKRKMIEDKELINSLADWGQRLKESDTYNLFLEYKFEEDKYKKKVMCKKLLNILNQKIQNLGFSFDISPDIAESMLFEMMNCDISYFNSKKARKITKENDALWKRAGRIKRAISAREYWENFFEQHPRLKPKHIYYYDGDPSQAVLDFQKKNNIGNASTVKTEGNFLGFKDNHVIGMEKDTRVYSGYQDLMKIASIIINERYKG